ncbi:MAG: bifunctional metallophosphatase/5'-nucleotidase [Deltaproteobacteria bacterium]|nr:bifunctional metallophosphatase/5'-nucleotidase [Deltaproteobacteria bacterium]
MKTILALLWAVLLIASCVSRPPKPTKHIETNVSILYQSNREGEMASCGCHSHPFGGLDREANLLSQVRKQQPHVIYVDSGNMLALEKPQHLDHARTKAKALIEMFNVMGLDVFAPGPQDYLLGIDFLKDLSTKAKYPFISSNVFIEGKPVFQPYEIIERGGVKFGFFSAIPKESVANSKVTVHEPLGILNKTLQRLESQVDIVVLLSGLSSADNEKIGNDEKTVHLIIGSAKNVVIENPYWFKGHSLLVDGEIRGMSLGKLDLELKLPFKGFYSMPIVEQNLAALSYWETEREQGRAQAANHYIDRIRRHKCLAPIEGGTVYTNALVDLDEKRFGAKNQISALIKRYHQTVRTSAIENSRGK